ncbi:h/aca ribonucleoprotein complex non-core subunit naf1 [Quercus suber]|uniref:H/ACA ribonucleoprotein complex non-core subunit NAF1 n=1 Tax=Quercus suber TaxID=58331 RepID=A0AAW0L564_QUESU
MVGFISEPTTENLDPVQKLKNSSHPLDPSDQKATDFSFSDSFPDFDSIKDWFEDIPVPGMADIGLFEFGADGSNSGVKVKAEEMETENFGDGSEPKVAEVKVKVEEEEEREKLGNFSKCIEEEMGRVSLDVEPGNLGLDGGGGSGVKSEVVSDGNESGSSVSSSESSESEIDSSSSEEGASSSDSSDDEEEEEGGLKEAKVEAATSSSDSSDDEEEEEEGLKEVKVLPPVPPVNETLQPHHQMLPVGVVLSILGAQVIVEGVEKHNPISEGSILWVTESRSPLGFVDEIFGPVKNPYYKIRYNSESEVPSEIHEGSLISFVPEFANHVLNDKSLYQKGYDASGANDEEMSDEAEFSDDEKEAEYKRMQKMTKRGTQDENFGNRKNNRRKVRNKDGPWKNTQPSPQNLPSNQSQHNFSPSAAFFDRGSSSSSIGQGFGIGNGFIPPFPPTAQTIGFNTPSNGVWANGMAYQPPQGAVFPNGFPCNGMPWFSQNPHQHPCQMPMPNRMPFQQHFDPSQTHPTANLPGVGPTYAQGLMEWAIDNFRILVIKCELMGT